MKKFDNVEEFGRIVRQIRKDNGVVEEAVEVVSRETMRRIEQGCGATLEVCLRYLQSYGYTLAVVKQEEI